MAQRYIGVDVGGTKVSVAVLEGSQLSEPHLQPTALSDSDALIDQLAAVIEAQGPADAVGIGVPSVIDFATGRARHSVNVPLQDVPLRKILTSWPLAEQRRFFEEEAGLPLALEPETGKLFPASNSARQVRDRLLALACGRGAEVRFDALVTGLAPPDDAASWRVRLADGEEIPAAAVVVATGGLSLPGTGSDGTGFALIRRRGHTLHETYPALTPLTLEPPLYAPLAGISRPVTLSAPGPVVQR